MVERRALWAILVVAMSLLSGCAGKKGDAGAFVDADGDGINDADQEGQLPDGLTYTPGYVGPDGGYIEGDQVSFFCQSFANSTVAIDQNRTLSGNAHSHDMWGGDDSKVIFEGEVTSFQSGNWFVMPGAVVHPGAGRAEFRLDWELRFDGDWRQLGVEVPGIDRDSGNVHVDYLLNFTEPGQVLSIEFNFTANDRPHAERTAWNFQMVPYNQYGEDIAGPDDPAAQQTVGRTVNGQVSEREVTVQWTIFRTYDCLPVDPPHYDMWDGQTQRLVASVTTQHDYTQLGVFSNTTSNPGVGAVIGGVKTSSIVPPGTATLIVDLRWSAELATAPLGLTYVGADQDARSVNARWQAPPPDTNEPNHRRFVIDVHPLETDSPYANKTAWAFRVHLDQNVDELDRQGRFKGDVDWEIIAYREGFAPA